MTEPTFLVQLRCARRELALRHKLYPRWVGDGRMTQEEADAELAAMQAIVKTLVNLCGLDPACNPQLNLLPGTGEMQERAF